MEYRAIKISGADNVAVVVADVPQGAVVKVSEGGEVVANQPVPLGHKIALSPIAKGKGVVRYGEVICTADEAIKTGDWVHLHNTRL